jgi:hypothetical protein
MSSKGLNTSEKWISLNNTSCSMHVELLDCGTLEWEKCWYIWSQLHCEYEKLNYIVNSL